MLKLNLLLTVLFFPMLIMNLLNSVRVYGFLVVNRDTCQCLLLSEAGFYYGLLIYILFLAISQTEDY